MVKREGTARPAPGSAQTPAAATPGPAQCPGLPPLQALMVAMARIEDRLERALSELDLSMGKLKVLQHLQEADASLPLRELASRSSCVRSNITQLVDRLEADGLVRRVDDPEDRRSVRATLTPEGRARLQAGKRLLADQERQLADRLPAADARRLLAALASLVDA